MAAAVDSFLLPVALVQQESPSFSLMLLLVIIPVGLLLVVIVMLLDSLVLVCLMRLVHN